MIDTHTHLDSLRHTDPDSAVQEARAAGVEAMVSVGCGGDSIERTLQIARRYPGVVYVAAGVHPQQAAAFEPQEEWARVEELCAAPEVVAIGETGFDQFRDHGSLEQQQPAFELQADLARRTGKPLVIHTRAAERHTLDALAQHAGDLTVVLHCFSLAEHVEEVLAHDDWYCSFAGNVTYGSAQELRDAAARLPAERILVETDAPYLTPVPHRGTPNEPARVRHTLECIAGVRGWSLDEADAITTQNARRCFSLAGGG